MGGRLSRTLVRTQLGALLHPLSRRSQILPRSVAEDLPHRQEDSSRLKPSGLDDKPILSEPEVSLGASSSTPVEPFTEEQRSGTPHAPDVVSMSSFPISQS